LIKELKPGATRVAVLSDDSDEGEAVVEQIQAYSSPLLKVTQVSRAGTLQAWMDAVQQAQTQADALVLASYSSVVRQPYDATAVPQDELLRATAQANRLPDFTFWKDAVGREGVLACLGISQAAEADLATRMALQSILKGAEIGKIRVANVRETFVYVSLDRAQDLGVRVPEAYVRAQEPPVVPRGSWFSRFLSLFWPERKPPVLNEPAPPATGPAEGPGSEQGSTPAVPEPGAESPTQPAPSPEAAPNTGESTPAAPATSPAATDAPATGTDAGSAPADQAKPGETETPAPK